MQMLQWLSEWVFRNPQFWGFCGLTMVAVSLWHVCVLLEQYQKERS